MKLESTLQPRRGMLHFASMLDVVFLLLLFFLLSSNAVVRSGIAVVPPQSRSALKAAATADIITLSAGPPAQIFYNDRQVSMDELGELLQEDKAGGSRKQVVLRAEETAPYGLVIKISNLVVGNDRALILATRPQPEG